MMEASGSTERIPGADTVSNWLKLRMNDVMKELICTLEESCQTIALSIDGWTSQNSIPMLAVNSTWLSPDFIRYRACLGFIEVQGSHSGMNLASYVYEILLKFQLRQKFISITGDNASNNDTLSLYLLRYLRQRFHDFLDEHKTRRGDIQFRGEESQIQCFAHICHLIVGVILSNLGAGTHKEAVAILDNYETMKGRPITISQDQSSGVIAKLQLIVLWVARSPLRIQEWDQLCPRAILTHGGIQPFR
jgi:hypothetical protein